MSRRRKRPVSRRRVLTGGRKRRRAWQPLAAGVLLVAALTAVGVALRGALNGPDERSTEVVHRGREATAPSPVAGGSEDPRVRPHARPGAASEGRQARPPALSREGGADVSRFALDLSTPDAVQLRFVRRPRAGLMFDAGSGRVLWRLNPSRRVPIASLTKLMTALVVTELDDPHDRVRISKRAVTTQGSAVGVLPRGKKVQLEALLNGLLLVSGNDAAVALAEHTAGGVHSFVTLMNQRAAELRLPCTHFTTPHGLVDRGNYSCVVDLGVLARAALAQRRIRRIARRDRAIVKFPIKGGRLFLYNNNPLIRSGYKGTTGLKTGYTRRAGRSIIATVRRGGVELGVVLLDSYNPAEQARKLFKRGFRALRGRGTP